MGGEASKAYSQRLPEDIVFSELTYFRGHQTCSANQDLSNDLNRDLRDVLISLYTDQSINNPVPDDVINLLGQNKLSPVDEQTIKAVLLDRINEFRMKDDLDERFYDSRLMSVITCLYGNFWTIDQNSFKAAESVRQYFRVTDNLSIGEWGTVLRAKNGGSNMDFIIKTQNTASNSELTIHEAFVAMYALNKLRAYCPNFSCIYGGFVCGTPDPVSGEICKGNLNVPYSIYEAISGQSLYDTIVAIRGKQNVKFRPAFVPGFLKFGQNSNIKQPAGSYVDPDYELILSSIIQVAYSLKIAQARAYSFSHRDLHTNNIILRPLKSRMAIKYESKSMVWKDPMPEYLENRGLTGDNVDSNNRTYEYIRGQAKPDTEKIYYVSSTHVATIIDYDMAELYIPFRTRKEPNVVYMNRFGRRDLDPQPHPIQADPILSRMKDLSKMLGFTALAILNSQVSDDFKEAICDLYIDTLRPYYTIYSQQVANPDIPQTMILPYTFAQKVALLVRDRAIFFGLTDTQVQWIRAGIVSYDLFFQNFKRIIPPHYLDSILLEVDVKASVAHPIPKDKILECDINCDNETSTYEKLMRADPLGEAEAASSNPVNLAYHSVDAYRSARKFTNISTEEDISMNRLLAAEAKMVGQNRMAIIATITRNISEINRMLAAFVVPDSSKFHEFKHPMDGVQAYDMVLKSIFKLIKLTKEAIDLNNSLVYTGNDGAIINRANLIQIVGRIVEFINRVVVPWKKTLTDLGAANYFGEVNGNMLARVTLQLPNSITFDPIS